jgi:uncharacterized protein (TIGR02588 family)
LRSRHAVEWIAVAVSALAIATLVALLVYDGTTRRGGPELVVVLEAPVESERGFVVPLLAENHGGMAAGNVEIEVMLTANGRELQTGAVTLDFVPAGSEVDAAVVFTEDPAGGRLEARVLGFQPV